MLCFYFVGEAQSWLIPISSVMGMLRRVFHHSQTGVVRIFHPNLLHKALAKLDPCPALL